MTLTYLDKTVNATVDAFGNAKIVNQLMPATGQYWLPTFIHMATQFQGGVNGMFPIGRLHMGAPDDVHPWDGVDISYNVTNDTSGVLAGSVINPGQAIKGQWFGALPGDTVYLRVVGVSSDEPPTIGIGPEVPGPRFACARQIDGAMTDTTNPGNTGIYVAPLIPFPVTGPGAAGTPFPVTPSAGSVFTTSPQATLQNNPNNNAPFASSVAAGGTMTLVAAGSNLFLHTFQYDIDPGTNTTANWQLQDTSGAVITNLHFEGVSTTNNPAHAPIDFKGWPNAAALGIQVKNNSGATSAIFGNLLYSK